MARAERQRRWRAPDGTVARLIEARLDLYLLCRRLGCGHRRRLTIDDLRLRFPPRLNVDWIIRHAHCTACGARWPEIESRLKEPKVGTLGDLIAYRQQLWLHCENSECRRYVEMPVPALAERYGVDLTLMALMLAARCSRCSTRWPNLECQATPRDTSRA